MPPLLVLIACHHSCLRPLLSPPSRRIIFTTTCYRGFHLFFLLFFFLQASSATLLDWCHFHPGVLSHLYPRSTPPSTPTSTAHRSIFPEVVRPSIPARPIPAKCPTPTPGRPRAAKLLLARTKTTASKSPRKSRAMHRSPTIWRQYI